MRIYCLLFPDYEALDLMGPVEFLHFLPDVQLHYTSLTGGNITAHQQFSVATVPLSALPADSLLLLPGGMGTRALVHDAAFLAALARACAQSTWVLSVCTGASCGGGRAGWSVCHFKQARICLGAQRQSTCGLVRRRPLGAGGQVLHRFRHFGGDGHDARLHRRSVRRGYRGGHRQPL